MTGSRKNKNVLDLVKQVAVSDIEDYGDSSSNSSSSSDGAGEDGMVEDGAAEADDKSRYSGLRYKKDNTNQRNVFLACRFLSGRLPDLMFPKNNSINKFSVARLSHSFMALIKELRRQEPTLKQATAIALHSMYDRVVKQYGELDAVLEVETGGHYEHKLTQLAKYARDIYNLHNDFVAQKVRTTAERKLANEHGEKEQEVINAAVVQGSKLTRGERRALDHAEGNDAGECSSSSVIAKSASTKTTATKPSTRFTPATTLSVSQTTLDLEGTLDFFYDSIAKLKAMVRTQGDELIDLRAEIRQMKRKFGNVEADMTNVQKDIYSLKKKK
ncbi:hypothetical protein BGX24_004732 [Mortierella sp. AD032]|nr:hypothetical protein BGX24_004732 [Mortierella sp. AD032]